MILTSARKKIDKYLDSSCSTPIIVDVPSTDVLTSIKSIYNVGSNQFIESSDYCGKDTAPLMERLENDLSHKKNKVFLTGLSTFLKLEGNDAGTKRLQSLLDLTIEGKLVIITYQAGAMLNFSDPRPKSAGRVIIIDSDDSPSVPVLYFVSPDLSEGFELFVDGLDQLPKFVEGWDSQELYVKTKRKKSEFPESLYDIRSYSSTYEILSKAYSEVAALGCNFGTDEQWSYLKSKLEHYGDWQTFISKEFGGVSNLPQNIGNFNQYNSEKKWAYFVALSTCGASGFEYLSRVIAKARTLDEFYELLYTELLNVPVKNKHFKSLFIERKQILKAIDFPLEIVSNYCKQVMGKGQLAIHYLTDLSIQEKELVIDQINSFWDSWTRKELESILGLVYPDLQVYLSMYNYKIPLLTKYFDSYKYNKVINHILPEFRELVEEQALKREYNSILQPRAFELSKKQIVGSKLFFVDALGVEFLSFIQDRLYRKKLDYQVSFARCDLPSITCFNKDFVDTFKSSKCCVVDIKELDDLKHDGANKYNYEVTKLPIHIIEEFAIIDKVIKGVEEDLFVNGFEKVFIISDHGASRLAVINERENKWELSQKGEHSGRCCPTSDVDDQPDYATEENGYWCLANYDRFKGGRKANVEVHGGASLEEVVIPIIEIKKGGDKPKCFIDEDYRVVVASFKTNAVIRLFVAKESDKIRVALQDKVFNAVPSGIKYYYDVELPGVRKGNYSIDVYDDNSLIAQGLTFEVKSAGASENKFF